ncbi:marine proteobacterial sortase target protein [uncultured Paraglaciecola sp.]|uniref:marine proteobacterial sortase target protein n=1 Tax=uncultured Paraglaciecola sp. TaxID=1765024 RepID=UPI0030D9A061|tara:strand:+ start:802 stop:3075 length:2274 start_codon:yes stop_codon:yes gene_type:complete
MSLLLKLSGLLLVICTIGVLHSAASQYLIQPELNGDIMHKEQQSPVKYRQVVADKQIPQNVYVDSISDVAQGSLFYTRHQPTNEQNNTQSETGVLEHKRRYQLSPLLSTDVKIRVTGMIARTQVTQRFHNPSQDWVNGIYAFPLPENAAVDHLSMTIGERVINGIIMPKEQAKAHFDKAQSQGRKASLIEQRRPNLFTNAIANIGPLESLSITIEYQQVVSFDEQTFSLRFPMTITPRYSPTARHPDTKSIVASVNEQGWASSTAALSQQIKPVAETTNPIRISVDLDSGFLLNANDIVSEHHKVTISSKNTVSSNDKMQDYHISFAQQQPANHDFSLTWRPAASDLPSAAHFSEIQGDYRYGLVMLTPPLQDTPNNQRMPRDVILLLDTSGSMAGESIIQAKQAVAFALTQLHADDKVNIIEFNDQPRPLWDRAMPANAVNIQRAKNWVSGLIADGGTEMAPALTLALHNKTATNNEGTAPVNSTLRQVIFITDGSVSNEDALMSLIENQLDNSRLFTIGIGSAPNSYFMTQAAQAGRGTFTYIGDVNQVQQKMRELFTKLTTPVMQDIHIDFVRETEFYPSVIPDLYAAQPVVIHYRVPVLHSENGTAVQQPNNAIKVTGRQSTLPWSVRMPLSPTPQRTGLGVAWARQKITQLSNTLRREQNQEMRQKWQKSITDLALEHHIVSQFTSLIAIDEQISRPKNETSKNKPIQHNLPAGSTMMAGNLPQTASNMPLHITLGLLLIGGALCARSKQVV